MRIAETIAKSQPLRPRTFRCSSMLPLAAKCLPPSNCGLPAPAASATHANRIFLAERRRRGIRIWLLHVGTARRVLAILACGYAWLRSRAARICVVTPHAGLGKEDPHEHSGIRNRADRRHPAQLRTMQRRCGLKGLPCAHGIGDPGQGSTTTGHPLAFGCQQMAKLRNPVSR